MTARRRLPFGIGALLVAACGIDAVGALDGDGGAGHASSNGGAVAGGDGDANGPGDDDGSARADAALDADGGLVDGAAVLQVTVTGSTAGATVTSNVGGIACPPACTAFVAPGTNVTLSATVPADESLVEWSGACSGRGPSCALTVAGATSAAASFARLVQYVHSPTNLFTVDGATGATTLVAAFGGACSGITVGDIAVDRTGKAYATTLPSGGGESSLYPLTLATASCGTTLGSLGRRCNALTFAPSPTDPTKDVLYAACTVSFYRVDETTADMTLLGGLGLASSGDVVWVPGRGVFITLDDGTGTDKLGKVNVATGAATVIGTGVGRGAVYALGHRAGKILGYGNGFAITIDPVTGAGTTLDGTTAVDAYGAASGP